MLDILKMPSMKMDPGIAKWAEYSEILQGWTKAKDDIIIDKWADFTK